MKKLALTFVMFVMSLSALLLPTASLAQLPADPGGGGCANAITTYHFIDAETVASPVKADCTYDYFTDDDTSNGKHLFINHADPSLDGKCTVRGGSDADDWKAGKGKNYVDFTADNSSWPGKAYVTKFSVDPDATDTYCLQKGSYQSVTASSNKDIGYKWVDQNTIQALATSDNSNDQDTYSYDAASKTFIDTQGTCKSSIAADPSGTTGKRTRRTKDQPTVSAGRGGSRPDPSYKKVNGCYVEKTPDSIKIALVANKTKDPTSPGGSKDPTQKSSTAPPDDPCADAAEAYSWLICPAVTKAQKFTTSAYDNAIEPLLQVDPITQNTSLKKVTAVFVNLADVFFVIIFLIMIFGTSMNINAYTVKKVLPKVVIAAIAIQFSYFICGVIIDIGNIFGDGILDLVQSAIGTTAADAGVSHPLVKNLIAGGEGLIVLGAAGTAIAVFGVGILLLVVSLAISVLIFIVTLVIRKLIIDILIILSPLAFAAWVLPNTEHLYKKWSSLFIKTVMVYPVISLLLASGYIVQKASSGTSAVNQLIGLLAPLITFCMMPLALKWGGTAVNFAGGAARKYTGAKWAQGASSKAGSAPIKNRVAAFNQNRAAVGVARRNGKLDNKGFSGMRARVQAGVPTGIGIGSGRAEAAQRIREQRLATARGEEVKNLTTSNKNRDLSDIVDEAASASASANTRQAAVNTLASKGDTGNLDKIRQQMIAEQGADAGQKAFATMVGESGSRSEIAAKAPHLVAPNAAAAKSAYGNMSESDMTKLDANGWKALHSYASSSPAAKAGVDEKLNRIAGSERLNSQMKGDARKYSEIIRSGKAMPSDADGNFDSKAVSDPSFDHTSLPNMPAPTPAPAP